uniref:beta-L-arabinofuranosidase domain-containing protein n=1 Tax=Rhodanobacter glycinis TaxID=582702 RepID=UPI00155B2B4E|nr:beta-L-arabinofuranosidase domain-containing protein [Rhodanobacter glycinis]
MTLAKPVTMALNLRVPAWIGPDAGVRLNGKALAVFASPGSYLTLRREWHDGDRIELELPMTLISETLPGDDSLRAVRYGPLVLAARLSSKGITHDMQYAEMWAAPKPEPTPQAAPQIAGNAPDKLDWIVPAKMPLAFTARTRHGEVPVVPLNQIRGERYAVYWQAEPAAASGA